MSYDWIVDVIGDLRSFAGANGLPRLAEHLEAGIDLAETEIAGLAEAPVTAHIDGEAEAGCGEDAY